MTEELETTTTEDAPDTQISDEKAAEIEGSIDIDQYSIPPEMEDTDKAEQTESQEDSTEDTDEQPEPEPQHYRHLRQPARVNRIRLYLSEYNYRRAFAHCVREYCYLIAGYYLSFDRYHPYSRHQYDFAVDPAR